MGVGNNTYGEFGLGDKESRDHPTRVGDDSDWARVAAGDSHSLAVKRDGAAWAWGYGGDGQLGLPDTGLLDRPEHALVEAQKVAANEQRQLAQAETAGWRVSDEHASRRV